MGFRARLRQNFGLWVALSVGLLGSNPCAAESTSGDKAAAEALFDQGVSLLRNHQYKEACEKLETSQKIDPAVGTLLYLGECYERLGRTASAWAMFREASSLAQTNGQGDRAKIASQRAERLEPDLAYLTVNVPPDARVPGLVIRRGNDVVKPELFGVSIPTDPGEIKVEASAPGYQPFSQSVSVAARERSEASVPVLDPIPAEPPAEIQPAVAEPASSAHGPPPSVEPVRYVTDPSPVSYVLAGAGLLGIGVGSFFGVKAIQRNHDATRDYGCSGSICTDPRGLDVTDEARRAARVSNIAFAAGGVLLASGVILYLSAPRHPERAVLLTPSQAGASLSLRRSF
jgi:serine/threonine-protein kinase